jgi:hypothetical protein
MIRVFHAKRVYYAGSTVIASAPPSFSFSQSPLISGAYGALPRLAA